MKKSLMLVVSMVLVLSVFLSACAPATPAATEAPAATAAPVATDVPAAPAATDVPAAVVKTVGISMPTKTSTRWISDGDSMVKAFEALGYKTDLQFADNDINNQLSQIENMVTKGRTCSSSLLLTDRPCPMFSRRLMMPACWSFLTTA
jgi:putative multiple sugar transport system substrate-binding protein